MKTAVLAIGLTLFAGITAFADWNVGDGHKMHFPQLPDPNGWDVDFTTPNFLADDWKCSETGPVKDIHFWVSHQGGVIPVIYGLDVKIFSNVPAGVGGPNFSQPGQELWDSGVTIADLQTAPGGQGDQGWFDPYTGQAIPNDHHSFFQINLTDFDEPFIQEEGRIYWLGKTADLNSYPAPYTGEHYEDDAVYRDATGWHELHYPTIDPVWGGQSMDLAFVITPEPGTIVMLASVGVTILLLVRRRRKR